MVTNNDMYVELTTVYLVGEDNDGSLSYSFIWEECRDAFEYIKDNSMQGIWRVFSAPIYYRVDEVEEVES